jgi:type II secretory pathway component GspD/PulD (secretin)
MTAASPMRTGLLAIVLAGVLGMAGAASGQVTKLQTTVKHRPTFVDADLAKMAAYVGNLTSRTLELEPGVCALVTARYDKPQSPDQLYRSFVEIVRALGYLVVEEGLVTRIQLAQDTPSDPPPACRRYPVRNNGQN